MANRSINLVLDWDGTITRKDTMFAMAEIASIRDRRLGNQSSAAKQWDAFGKAYMDDYAAHQERYIPKAPDRLDRVSESAWLKSLDVVETQSAERVEASGFFHGAKRADVDDAARHLYTTGQVSLRPGSADLFLRARKPASGPPLSVNLSILSVNWSETFIRTSLRASIASRGYPKVDEQIDDLQILTNEIDGLDDPNGSSGHLNVDSRPSIRTSFDKLQRLKHEPESINVYVGDSATDFDCLLAADVGICIRDEPMGSSQSALSDTLARLKLGVVHVNEVVRLDDSNQTRLFWARDFEEINGFLSHIQTAGA